ncbi:MAG: DnaJ domain-containing protein [Candidatus Aphodosoma sp.]
MGLLSKILAGGLGWTLGGPIGVVMGVWLASVIEKGIDNKHHIKTSEKSRHSRGYNMTEHTANDFEMALLVLIAAIMKADGKVVKSELDSVKRVLLNNYGEQGTLDALQILKTLLQQDIDITPVATQCGIHLSYSMRLQLLHILYDIAAVDGEVNRHELSLLQQIARCMRISEEDITSITGMFTRQSNQNWAYDVLEIQPTATDYEVKKAYRRMAMKYHPDKVSTLGEDAKSTATEKFRKVKEAYDTIKKQRGID